MKVTKAREIMTKDVITVTKQTILTDVMQLLLDNRISGLPVVDADGMLEGIVSEIDLVNSMLSGNAADTNAGEIMSSKVTSFSPDANCAEMAECFAVNHIRRFPIVDHGKVVGIVSRRDVLRKMLSLYEHIKS